MEPHKKSQKKKTQRNFNDFLQDMPGSGRVLRCFQGSVHKSGPINSQGTKGGKGGYEQGLESAAAAPVLKEIQEAEELPDAAFLAAFQAGKAMV